MCFTSVARGDIAIYGYLVFQASLCIWDSLIRTQRMVLILFIFLLSFFIVGGLMILGRLLLDLEFDI